MSILTSHARSQYPSNSFRAVSCQLVLLLLLGCSRDASCPPHPTPPTPPTPPTSLHHRECHQAERGGGNSSWHFGLAPKCVKLADFGEAVERCGATRADASARTQARGRKRRRAHSPALPPRVRGAPPGRHMGPLRGRRRPGWPPPPPAPAPRPAVRRAATNSKWARNSLGTQPRPGPGPGSDRPRAIAREVGAGGVRGPAGI